MKYKTKITFNCDSSFDLDCVCLLSNLEIKLFEKLKNDNTVIESFCCGRIKCFFCKCIVKIKNINIVDENCMEINNFLIKELFIILRLFHRN